MPLLEWLNVGWTRLKVLDVSVNTHMRELYCQVTKITLLAVDHMLNLEILAIQGTKIKSLNVVSLHKLKLVWGCDIEGRNI